jgi:hypothetical protein
MTKSTVLVTYFSAAGGKLVAQATAGVTAKQAVAHR